MAIDIELELIALADTSNMVPLAVFQFLVTFGSRSLSLPADSEFNIIARLIQRNECGGIFRLQAKHI